MQNNGQLIVVVGPSGSGKDTLLKKTIKKIPNSILVKRYITRKKDNNNEDHFSISVKNFQDKISKKSLSLELMKLIIKILHMKKELLKKVYIHFLIKLLRQDQDLQLIFQKKYKF